MHHCLFSYVIIVVGLSCFQILLLQAELEICLVCLFVHMYGNVCLFVCFGGVDTRRELVGHGIITLGFNSYQHVANFVGSNYSPLIYTSPRHTH